MARSNRPRRQFEWARAQGFGAGVVIPGVGAAGAVDLLADARTRWGNAVFRGATVMTVKGYIRPALNFQPLRVTGTAGFRVASWNDVTNFPTQGPEEAPFGNGRYEDWMGFLPYDVATNPSQPSVEAQPATWNSAASPWGVDVQSSRKLEELGVTLGLFWYHAPTQGAPEDVSNLDYDLSIGLKLA